MSSGAPEGERPERGQRAAKFGIGVTVSSTEKPLSLRASISSSCQALVRSLFDDYRPEQHYMRGPGPKWREKHMRAMADGAAQIVQSPLFHEGVPA